MQSPPRQPGLILLGLALLAAGALVYAAAPDRGGPVEPINAAVLIVPPDRIPLFNGTVALQPGNATALDALLEAAKTANFTVEYHHDFGPAFVTRINGYANEGACGWLYEVNGAWADRSAGEFALADADRVRWYWGCDG